MKRLDGILQSILHGRPVYVYGVSVAVAAFPAAPWLLRLMVRVLIPIRVDGPVVQLFHPDHRMHARQALYREVTEARNLMLSLLVMVIYHLLNMADVLNVYWQRCVFFVRHIFQRRRAAAGSQERYVSIDLRDPDCLFGCGPANPAFSLQVAVTSLAGVLLLASRFRTTGIRQLQDLYDLAIPVSDFTKTVEKLLTGEFTPPAAWPGDQCVGEAMKDFARNAFWPTGDGKARWYFTGVFFVFLLLMYPVRPVTGWAVKPLPLYVVFLAVAYVGTALVFRVLKASLTYVDGRLGSQSD